MLYQVVQEYWPEFQAELASRGKNLPAYVTKEFEAYLKCERLEHGFLRVKCESCHDEKLVAFSCKKRGFCPSCGARRMAIVPPCWWIKFYRINPDKWGQSKNSQKSG